MREVMTIDRKKRRLTATQTPHKWDWVSAAILVALSLSFSLHPPSFTTTILLATLLFATPDRLTSAWARRHPPSAMRNWENSRILRRIRAESDWIFLDSHDWILLITNVKKVEQKLTKNCTTQIDIKNVWGMIKQISELDLKNMNQWNNEIKMNDKMIAIINISKCRQMQKSLKAFGICVLSVLQTDTKNKTGRQLNQ